MDFLIEMISLVQQSGFIRKCGIRKVAQAAAFQQPVIATVTLLDLLKAGDAALRRFVRHVRKMVFPCPNIPSIPVIS